LNIVSVFVFRQSEWDYMDNDYTRAIYSKVPLPVKSIGGLSILSVAVLRVYV